MDRKKLAILIIAVLLAGALLALLYAYKNIVPPKIELAPSYTIYKSGNMYYARDEDGNIDGSSSNAHTVIQYAIDHTDGLIFIKNGTYPISKNIIPDDKTHIKGESWNTILERTGSQSIFVWNPKPSDYLDNCIFENLQFNGKKYGGGGWIHAFFLWNVRNLTLKNLYVHHMPACGIEIKGTDGLTTQNVTVSHCKFEDCGEAKAAYDPHSVYFNGPTRGILVKNCESYRCYSSGFSLRNNVYDVEFRDCISNDAGADGFHFLDGIENLNMTNCQADNNKEYGFFFWQAPTHKPIYHVTINDCKASGNTISALSFKGSSAAWIEHIDVTNNKLRNQGCSKDIRLNEYCDHFRIIYNEGSLEYPTAGKDYEVHDNYG